MKKYFRLLLITAVLFVILIINCIIGFSKNQIINTDVTVLNDLAQTVLQNLDNPQQLENYDFGVDYIFFDKNGRKIYENKPNQISTVSEAIKLNLIHFVIEDDYRYYGEIVLTQGINQLQQKLRLKLLVTIITTSAIFLILILLLGIYINNSLLKPFAKMEEFATEIAYGNLDVELPMTKDKTFQSLTESFDIMREEIASSRQKEIELKKKEKELVATLSHDLKTPITGIKLTSELLKVKLQDEYAIEKIDNIYQKADQIDALVNDLFASTLEDLGQMNVNCKDEESSCLSDIVNNQDDKKLVSQNEIPACLINIDFRRMKQIIANIISNSYKYANTKIDIEYTLISGYLQMTIRDYGPGMSENEIHLVTNKFYRGKSEKTVMQEGSGLGLYIAKNLIEKMNGEIICSLENPGFKVTLLIPLS